METLTALLIVGGILVIVLAPLFAFVGSCAADMKGRSKGAWLILCGLFFPMLILLFLLPRKKSLEFVLGREQLRRKEREVSCVQPSLGVVSGY
jgi:hypothetical protein